MEWISNSNIILGLFTSFEEIWVSVTCRWWQIERG